MAIRSKERKETRDFEPQKNMREQDAESVKQENEGAAAENRRAVADERKIPDGRLAEQPDVRDRQSSLRREVLRQEAQQQAERAAGVRGTEAQLMRYKPKLSDLDVKEAHGRFVRYKAGRNALEERVKRNEEYYRLAYDRYYNEKRNGGEPKSISGYLLNSVNNKVADAMDNYPQASVLPREQSDEDSAKMVQEILKTCLKRNNFQRIYYMAALEKVKNGFSIYANYWNPLRDNIGDVEIKNVDVMNIVWEPGIKDIQDSKDVFVVNLVDNDELKELYPELKDRILSQGAQAEITEYVHDDDVDTSEKTPVFDWYYKRKIRVDMGNGIVLPRTVVHYAKFAGDKLLYASENVPGMEMGWYEDGMYPFVIDVLFPVKDSPVGFGYVDVMRNPQEYIDKLDSAILRHALIASRPRYFSNIGSGINEDEFADLSKDIVHYNGTADGIKPVEVPGLEAHCVTCLSDKKEELKENSGNRDFSQGTTSGGVTAASAIAALQEASSKTSRCANIVSYGAFEELCKQVIGKMQQFYTIERTIRVTSDNQRYEYMRVGKETLRPGAQIDKLGQLIGGRQPIYDLEISAQKASPFSTLAQNELAKELFNMGAFNPQLADQVLPALEMMEFQGKEKVLAKVRENQQMLLQLQRMQQLLSGLGGVIAESTGNTRLLEMFGGAGAVEQPVAQGVASKPIETNSLGETEVIDDHSQAAQYRRETAKRAEVR